eukprot:3003157-Prymnesium_polylepis.2
MSSRCAFGRGMVERQQPSQLQPSSNDWSQLRRWDSWKQVVLRQLVLHSSGSEGGGCAGGRAGGIGGGELGEGGAK